MSTRRKKPLRLTRLRLENWRNFTHIDVELQNRVFLVGPNASGKSNLLDVFRFLRDIAVAGGGFHAAIGKPWRRGVDKLKSLAARHHADVGIQIHVGDDKSPGRWQYELSFTQNLALPKITKERVVKQGKEILARPNAQDEKDSLRLTQTYLQQVSVNEDFRELAEFLTSVSYLHLIPQAVRNLVYFSGTEDPFGGSFLRRMATLDESVRRPRIATLRDALRAAIPQLKELEFWNDPVGNRPHLRAKYEHLHGTWQLEDQFSDGTLRLIGLLWALLDGSGPLLLEEPELSLHPEVVRYLPQMFYGLQRRSGRQVMVSTHSPELLRDQGIGLNEVLLLNPAAEGTSVQQAADFSQIKILVESGLNLDEAVLPKTAPRKAQGVALVGG